MNENQQNLPAMNREEAEPEDARWYLQQMYDMAVEPLEAAAPAKAPAK